MTVVGAPGERVLLLRADLPDGENVSVGSGALIGPRLVLTAAHVVFDKGSGRPLDGVVAGPAAAARLSAARVVWPDSYRQTEDPAALDVALVEITEPGWEPPIRGAVRWGRLTGRSPGVPCEATGFPRVLRNLDSTRESDQISGTINPGAGAVRGRHDVTVTSAVPAPSADRRVSPWSGASGAGVFAAGLLTGVLVVDAEGFDHRRLTAVPCARVLAEPGVRGVLQQQDVGVDVESVELAEVLVTAGREAQVRRRRGRRLSPAMLLRADFEAVDFYGRQEQLAELTGWCADPELEVGVRLLVGPGGRGKTRLARQLVSTMRSHSPAHGRSRPWVAGFLRDRVLGTPLARVADTAAPVLLVVDYAETRAQQLVDLLPRLWDSDCAPVRLLLLARAGGDWWRQLGRDLGDPLDVPTALTTLDDTVPERRRSFQHAVNGFAARLTALDMDPGRDWAQRAANTSCPADLANSPYGNPLTVQLAALLGLLDGAGAAEGPGRSAWASTPEQHLLTEHEEKYWSATAPAGLNLHPDTLTEIVTAATLVGAADNVEALTILRGLPTLQGQPENTVVAVAAWLRDLYPAAEGQQWGSLQPDRVGEHLVAATLTRRPWLLPAIMSAASQTQRYQAVTVLARALTNTTIPGESRTGLASQISELYLADVDGGLAKATMDVATETADPVPLLAALQVVLGKLPSDRLRQLSDDLPERSLALAGLAAEVSEILVNHLRGTMNESDEHDTADLAASLNNLSVRLADLGRREGALAAIEEAVDLYRRLAAARPDVFTPDLALSLNNLSGRLADLGRREGALAAIEEAVDLRRRLAAARPDVFTPDLAMSLNNLSASLAVGRPEDALAAIEEAVDLRRRLAAARPDVFNPNLASSLNNLSLRLADLGRREGALAAIEEAVDLYRRLAAARPDVFTPDLALSLNNLSNRLADLGRREGALAAIEEAVDLYRRLAAARPDVFTPNLAGSLNNLSASLADLGRREDAQEATREATRIANV